MKSSKGNKEIFQSYESIIAVVVDGQVTLDKHFWDYSKTTIKYLKQFLGGTTKKEIIAKIDSGEYLLGELNND